MKIETEHFSVSAVFIPMFAFCEDVNNFPLIKNVDSQAENKENIELIYQVLMQISGFNY